jgi:hypothetical protein
MTKVDFDHKKSYPKTVEITILSDDGYVIYQDSFLVGDPYCSSFLTPIEFEKDGHKCLLFGCDVIPRVSRRGG